MYTFEKSIYINRPPQEVFDFVTNPATYAQWQSTTEFAEWTTDGPTGVGSTYKLVVKVGPRKIESENEITNWDPFNMFSIKGADGNLQATAQYEFDAKENGTQLTISAQIKGVGLGKLMQGFIGRMAEKQDGLNYDALKVLLEAN